LRRGGWIALSVLGLMAGLGAGIPLAWERALGPSVPQALIAGHVLSPQAQELVDRALAGLDRDRVLDHHAHLAGMGTSGSGCELSPEHLSWAHPWKRIQTLAYMRAGGVQTLEEADAQFAERLLQLIEHPQYPGRVLLLAFDRAHLPDGSVDAARSEFFVPLDWVERHSQAAPRRCLSAVSIHPYRTDALEVLRSAHARGVRMVKWLPNSMGIDPADARCLPFYAELARLDMTLLTHAGEEQAVDAGERQEYGNPLRLRAALQAGARVIVAHCASLGDSLDLDAPAKDGIRVRRSSFELFARMMDEQRLADGANDGARRGGLWGDLSAVTFRNRDARVLHELLRRIEWHGRLVNGSDWPLPAIRVMTDLDALRAAGLLRSEDVPLLEELQGYHPLLFDLVLKRMLRGVQGARFADEVFLARPEIAGW